MDINISSMFSRTRLDAIYTNALNKYKIIFVAAGVGYGKTVSVLSWLNNTGQEYQYVSAKDSTSISKIQDYDKASIIVIDDLSFLMEEHQETLFNLLLISKTKFILIGRITSFSFLTPFLVMGIMMTIGKKELAFTKEEVQDYLQEKNIFVSENTLQRILKDSHGLPLAVALSGHYLINHPYSEKIYNKVKKDYFHYLDFSLYAYLTAKQKETLLNVAVVDVFDESLAISLTGNIDIKQILQEIVALENILIYNEDNQFKFEYFEIFEYFKYKQNMLCTKNHILYLYQKTGRYYEKAKLYLKAMHYYDLAEDSDRLCAILVENTRKNASVARFYETDYYYDKLSKEQILASPELMFGMSLLYSVKLMPDESEKWYENLKNFCKSIDTTDERYKIAKEKLVYLGIALPHRGNHKVSDIIKYAASAYGNKKSNLQELSVTGDMPSIMSGGLDFSSWTKNDVALHAMLKKPIELALGKGGIGIADAGLGESLVEKNQNLNFTRSLTLLNSALADINEKGTKQMEFACLGIMCKIFIATGSLDGARRLIKGYYNRVKDIPELTLQPNVEALLTHIALYAGNEETITSWLQENEGKELDCFYSLHRYRYLILVRCYILHNKFNEALYLLDRLKLYFESYQRPFLAMQAGILRAITHFRMGDDTWKAELNNTLLQSENFGFTRVVADEGIAVLPLLIKLNYEGNMEYYKKILSLTRKQALQYPVYLFKQEKATEELTEMEKNVLSLMKQGLTNERISFILSISLRTVKFHTSNIYSKLNVKNRSEAIVKSITLE